MNSFLVCTHERNGFNDNIPGYPMRPCKYVRCPDPYMGADQPGTPIDPGKSQFTPYGTGTSSKLMKKKIIDESCYMIMIII